ncbi:MAG: hypothetical protein U9N37_05865 [Thermodesulfobacteriota bacterium]|nr:hypothetical protein [Thermodesulfobacteriota bacterium]
MLSFAQKNTKITTLHLLGRELQDLRPRLRSASRGKRTVLVVPTLATEFTLEENRPVFLNILKQLSRIGYLYRIIFGLDKATDEEALELADLMKKYGIRNYIIQHNEGAGFKGLYSKFNNDGFRLEQTGKGRNMFMSFGIAQALGADYIGVIDADIKTFHRRQLDRLFYPILVLNYQFSKAAYLRIGDNIMYGRVKRLLLDPLLLALKRKFCESGDEKFLRLIDYLLSFNYQLSGEVAFETSLLKRMHFATNWGVEIFTLIEVYRKANNIAQVQFSARPFEHKHQPVSYDNIESGLYKMAIDIVLTLFSTLVIEEGLEISDYFVRDLTITYLNVADELINKYSDNASFAKLKYDRSSESAMVRRIFKDAILTAGDYLTLPSHLHDRFLCIIAGDKRFSKYREAGLIDDLITYETKAQGQIFEMPQTASWEQIITKRPHVFNEIKDTIRGEKALYTKI